jgi:deoxyribodipyrimidine photolyase-related protein
MSDYCDTCAYDPKKKHGASACPFNSLYWDFFVRHRSKLASNPRIGMMYRTWHRMAAAERKHILRQADIYRKDLSLL